MVVDTHAHLASSEYDDDRDAVMNRAWEAGLAAIVVIGAGDGLESNQRALNLLSQDNRLFAAVGIHPHDAAGASEDWISDIRTMLQVPRVVAIGEIGLDFHYDIPRDAQRRWFRRQIELAHELSLPIVIHDRDAHDEILTILDDVGWPPRGGIFHCFSGDVALATHVTQKGFFISIAGVVTFKKADQLKDVVRSVPLEKMVLETDAPFLAPVPHRGKRNEPSFVMHVVDAVAEIKGVSSEDVAQTTSTTAAHLFGITLS